MIRSSSRQFIDRSLVLAIFLLGIFDVVFANSRANEVRQMMWDNGDPDFNVTEIPEKWQNKSAVIIAQSNHMEYRKELLVAVLYYNSYRHDRIMLLDQRALEDYAQMYIPEDGTYNGVQYKFYAGYKIIKPDGREIEVPMSSAVREEREVDKKGYNQKKLAIPNLEVGDILDFYNGEEQTINLSGKKYFSFEPVIFQLNREYPVVKRKISFDVLRRCFINMKTLNGAPNFKLTEDAKRERNRYFLESADLESVKDIKWLFENRALPTVKFKVTYAASSAARLPTFIGAPGVLKSTVSTKELSDFLEYILKSNILEGKYFTGYMKKHFKHEKNKEKLAREAFYAYRNRSYIRNAEGLTVSGGNPYSNQGTFAPAATLSYYFRTAKIPHELIIGIPRQISSIDNLILENELTFLIKVNTSKPFYLGLFNSHSVSGEMDEDVQGTSAFSINGLLTGKFSPKKVTLPATSHEQNVTKMLVKSVLNDLNDDKLTLEISKEVKGANRMYYQHVLMDIYDYLHEEKDKYKMLDNFESYDRNRRNRLEKQKEDYLSDRDKSFSERLKLISESDFDFEIDKASDLKIHQTGRHHDKPEFKASFVLTATGLLKRAGPNHILDVGKLIEGQLEIHKEERERVYDIYMPFARSYEYRIEVEIPQDHEVQGIEKLNIHVENETGGFISKSSMEGNTLVVDTYKYYKSNFEKNENWSKMCEFLDAAYLFTQQNVLIRKRMIN
jgi:hypothetical protein